MCEVSDVTGHGEADLQVFLSNGTVYVAESTGKDFVNSKIWQTQGCIGQQQYRLADVNGDNKKNLVRFMQDAGGNVFVMRTNGSPK